MTNVQSFDVVQREEQFGGVLTFPNNWALKIFLVRAPERRFPRTEEFRAVLEDILGAMGRRLSSEFIYGRFGFAIVHAGRRGVCVTVTHFGGWGTTFEVFSSGWYRYGHAFENFGLLDDMEPAMCWFEVTRSFEEIGVACRLAEDGFSLSEIREKYLEHKS